MFVLQKHSDLPIITGDTGYHDGIALLNRTDRKLLIGFRDWRETSFPHHSGIFKDSEVSYQTSSAVSSDNAHIAFSTPHRMFSTGMTTRVTAQFRPLFKTGCPTEHS
jgi:hypothetical protein